MSSRKTTTGTQRVRLLATFSEKSLSMDLLKKTSQHFANLSKSEREPKAKEMNEMLQTCRTKEQMEQAIKNYLRMNQ